MEVPHSSLVEVIVIEVIDVASLKFYNRFSVSAVKIYFKELRMK